jgi:hypothetical protein
VSIDKFKDLMKYKDVSVVAGSFVLSLVRTLRDEDTFIPNDMDIFTYGNDYVDIGGDTFNDTKVQLIFKCCWDISEDVENKLLYFGLLTIAHFDLDCCRFFMTVDDDKVHIYSTESGMKSLDDNMNHIDKYNARSEKVIERAAKYLERGFKFETIGQPSVKYNIRQYDDKVKSKSSVICDTRNPYYFLLFQHGISLMDNNSTLITFPCTSQEDTLCKMIIDRLEDKLDILSELYDILMKNERNTITYKTLRRYLFNMLVRWIECKIQLSIHHMANSIMTRPNISLNRTQVSDDNVRQLRRFIITHFSILRDEFWTDRHYILIEKYAAVDTIYSINITGGTPNDPEYIIDNEYCNDLIMPTCLSDCVKAYRSGTRYIKCSEDEFYKYIFSLSDNIKNIIMATRDMRKIRELYLLPHPLMQYDIKDGEVQYTTYFKYACEYNVTKCDECMSNDFTIHVLNSLVSTDIGVKGNEYQTCYSIRTPKDNIIDRSTLTSNIQNYVRDVNQIKFIPIMKYLFNRLNYTDLAYNDNRFVNSGNTGDVSDEYRRGLIKLKTYYTDEGNLREPYPINTISVQKTSDYIECVILYKNSGDGVYKEK